VAHYTRTASTFTGLRMPIVAGPAAGPDGVVFAEVEFTGPLVWRGVEHAGTGRAFRVPGVVVLRTAADHVVSVRTLFDRDEWLRGIGVSIPETEE
jgi:hypothetical protein